MQPNDIIEFWYSDRVKKLWFSSTPEMDKEILGNYESIWERALQNELDHWTDTASGSLALIIILDQFPLNMFRGEARSFKSEKKAIEDTKHAIKSGHHLSIEKEQLGFMFMPLMHSENLDDQNLCVKLSTDYQLAKSSIRFAIHHRDIIKNYGRFPHRNKILGRKSTDEELKYLASDKAFTG